MTDPLTDEQLKSFGFTVARKKKGQFDSCFLDVTKSTWAESEVVGTFYSPPSFKDIIKQITENAKSAEYSRIKEKLAQTLLDGMDI